MQSCHNHAHAHGNGLHNLDKRGKIQTRLDSYKPNTVPRLRLNQGLAAGRTPQPEELLMVLKQLEGLLLEPFEQLRLQVQDQEMLLNPSPAYVARG